MPEETAITTAKEPQSLKQIINSEAMQEQFKHALPKHLSPERFARIAITALTRVPKLKECTQQSVMKCLLDLSAIGLEPDGRHAHLIPYGKEATLVIDYKGLVSLVRRSGDVAKIHADVVCENDLFEHSMGEVITHTYDLKKDRGKAHAAYAQVTLKDGSVQAEIMTHAEIEAVRQKSQGRNASPWKEHWNEMAKKTAFRRLTKWLTLSPELSDSIAKADEHEFRDMRDVTRPRPQMRGVIDPFAAQGKLVESCGEPAPETPEQEKEAELELDAMATGADLMKDYVEEDA